MRRPRHATAFPRALPLLGALWALACREAPDEGGAPVSPFPPGAELDHERTRVEARLVDAGLLPTRHHPT